MSFIETVFAVLLGLMIYNSIPTVLRALAPSIEKLFGWAIEATFYLIVFAIPVCLVIIGCAEGKEFWRAGCLYVGAFMLVGIAGNAWDNFRSRRKAKADKLAKNSEKPDNKSSPAA